MAELTEVLALAFSSDDRWTSIKQAGRAFQDRLGARRALDERRPESTRRARGPTRVTSVPIGVQESNWVLWRGRGGFLRSEYLIGRETVSVVAQGNRWTRSSPTLGTVSGGGSGRPLRTLIGPAAVLLDTATLLRSTEPVGARPATVGGRSAMIITAQPLSLRGRARMALREAGLGADEYDFAIDTERGVLLSVAARHGTEQFQLVETTEISFDDELESSLFALESGTTAERTLSPQRVTLAEAASAAGFALYVPDPSPSPADPHVALLDGDTAAVGPRRVVLTYAVVDANRRGQLRLTIAGVDLPRSSELWERRGELEITLGRQRAIDRAKVRRRIGASTCELESSVLTLDELVEIAESLTPL